MNRIKATIPSAFKFMQWDQGPRRDAAYISAPISRERNGMYNLSQIF